MFQIILGFGTQVATLFPIDMWNHHHDVPQGIPRTTNAVEAWRRSYNATIGYHHPNIWRFIGHSKRSRAWLKLSMPSLCWRQAIKTYKECS